MLKEEKKIVTDDEIITVGADIVGQLVAIIIGEFTWLLNFLSETSRSMDYRTLRQVVKAKSRKTAKRNG